MAKLLPQQRRGKGKSSVYITPDHYTAGTLGFRALDHNEMEGSVKGVIKAITKDRVHYAPLMYVQYETGENIILPAVEGVYVGMNVYSGANSPINPGNVLPLKMIPEGTKVCMIEIRPGDSGKLVRTSGSYGIVVQRTDSFVMVKLPSKKVKRFHPLARALVGVVAGGGRDEKPFVKAGIRYYWMKIHHKIYPKSSAVARNACDHPFGGKHKRNKGKVTPLPKHGYPIKYGYYGSRKTGRGKGGGAIGRRKR